MTNPTASSSSTLSPTHPLLLELSALRAQLGQYQRISHQTSIALQGSRLELSLTQTENSRLSRALDVLRSEVETLRCVQQPQHCVLGAETGGKLICSANPSLPPIPPQSTALTELSLAHRRLSAKLDLTEDALRSAQLELASSKQEVYKLQKEREGDKLALRELRLAQDEWEEGMAWEKGERQKLEEQKKLWCVTLELYLRLPTGIHRLLERDGKGVILMHSDLALAEYSTLVHSLDPSAVPPTSPPRSSTPNILLSTPTLSESAPTSPPTSITLATPQSTSENISNLLIGQKGVSRLLADATSLLTSRETENRNLITRVGELERQSTTLQESLSQETVQRISAQNERDAVLRDDAAAAKVVERYMTFTQKTHATIHMHLDNLRIRSGATQNTLRKEVIDLQKALQEETGRGQRIKSAIDELSEGLARESAGRRREISLRLGMLANDEMRDRKVEKWLDRVRRTRKGPEGAILDATALEGLLDEGVQAVARGDKVEEGPKRWKVWGKRKEVTQPSGEADEGLMRVLLAEELVHNLVTDLGIETDRRMELEKQRVEWLAREALGGSSSAAVVTSEEGEKEGEEGGVVFEIGDDFDGPTPTPEPPSPIDPTSPALLTVDDGTLPPPARSRSPNGSPLIDRLREVFTPLEGRSEPLVKSLHDLSASLSSIRSSLPSPAPTSPLSPIKGKKFLGLRKSPLEDPALSSLLDGIHEVIEDARVDLEISRADEERVYRGFEALINVGKTGMVRENAVLEDAREYVMDRMDGKLYDKLRGRIEDVEGDMANIKQKIHELSSGGEFLASDDPDEVEIHGKAIWEGLDLRTVSTSTFNTRAPSPLSGLSNFVSSPLTPLSSLSFGMPSPSLNPEGGKQNPLAVVGNMGRSFSAGVISAPRKVGGLAIAGGLSFKRAVNAGKAELVDFAGGGGGGGGGKGEEKKLLDDDVE